MCQTESDLIAKNLDLYRYLTIKEKPILQDDGLLKVRFNEKIILMGVFYTRDPLIEGYLEPININNKSEVLFDPIDNEDVLKWLQGDKIYFDNFRREKYEESKFIKL